MAFSGLYGLTQNCAHTVGQPASRVGVSLAASLDIIATVAIAVLIAFGAKMGVHIPSMGQYMLGFAAVINMMMLLHKNIIPVTENFRPVLAKGEVQQAAPTYVTHIASQSRANSRIPASRRGEAQIQVRRLSAISSDSDEPEIASGPRTAWSKTEVATIPAQVVDYGDQT